MSYSLTKLKSKKTGDVFYDYTNDSCDTHNLYSEDLNDVSSFRFDEWFEQELLFQHEKMSKEEHEKIYNLIKNKD